MRGTLPATPRGGTAKPSNKQPMAHIQSIAKTHRSPLSIKLHKPKTLNEHTKIMADKGLEIGGDENKWRAPPMAERCQYTTILQSSSASVVSKL